MSDFNKDEYLNDLPDMDDLSGQAAPAAASAADGASADSAAAAAGATQEGAAQPAAAQSQENGDSAAADGADKAGAADGKADDTLTPLGQAKKEAAEYLEALQRERAEFINFRNRAQKEQERFRQHGIIDVLTALLPALDDIDRIREHSEMDDSFKAVANKIDKAFEKFGVEKFGEKGEDFDPTKHDAILHKPDPNAEKETVDTVVEAGYRIGDRVIRAARVVVASPAPPRRPSSPTDGRTTAVPTRASHRSPSTAYGKPVRHERVYTRTGLNAANSNRTAPTRSRVASPKRDTVPCRCG